MTDGSTQTVKHFMAYKGARLVNDDQLLILFLHSAPHL